ncbi:MAG: adenylate/guanylate cyclase domain-containing protein [Pseudomonadota bacterium]
MREDPPTLYTEIDGLSIAYQIWGDGPRDLVLIPGIVSHLEFSLDDAAYRRWVEDLAMLGRLAVFDKRGNGMSDRIDGAPTIDERMRDVEAVMEAAGMDHATLIGFSEGAAMAIALATMRPERVDRLVLCGGYAEGRRVRGDIDTAAVAEIADQLRENWGRPDGTHVFSAYGPDPSDAPGHARWMRMQRVSSTPNTTAALFQMAADIDVRQLLPSVQVPALVVHREAETNNERVARSLLDGIADVTHVVLPGDDHMPWEGDQSGYTAAIRAFVTGAAPVADPAMSISRVLGSVLFTDLVNSTQTMATLGDTAWRERMNRHDAICARHVAQHKGQLVKFTGDGMLAWFDTPTHCVACALALSYALADLDLPSRAGIHTGEIELREDDISGLGVVVAARIMEQCANSQVLVSDLTRQLMLGAPYTFEKTGDFSLKGLSGDWPLYRIT